MPINFELTFTTPIVTSLKTGTIKGANDHARLFADAYVRTLLTGTPQGTPYALPAPGLNPVTPPTYPIPKIPINNFAQRKQAMEKVLRVYFQINQVLNFKADIVGSIQTLSNLVKRSKNIRQDISRLIKQVTEIIREIQQLPQLLQQILKALGDIVRRELDQVRKLFSIFDDLRLTMPPIDFQQKFRDEIEIYNNIKNFRVSVNISDYRIFLDMLNDIEFRLESLPNIRTGNEEDDLKAYFYNQLRRSLYSIGNITKIFTAPQQFINFFQDLVAVDNTLAPALQLLYRYKFIETFLKPKIVKLRAKITKKYSELVDKVNKRIEEEKKRIKEKRKEQAAKAQGEGQVSLFKQAGTMIKDFKEKELTKIRKLIKLITNINLIVRLAINLFNDILAFKSDVISFLDRGLVEYLERNAKTVASIVTDPERSVVDMENDLNRIMDSINMPQIFRNFILTNLVGKIPSPTTFLNFLESKPNDVQLLFGRSERILNNAERLTKLVRNVVNPNEKESTLRSDTIIRGIKQDIDGYKLENIEKLTTVGQRSFGISLEEEEIDIYVYKRKKSVKNVLSDSLRKTESYIKKLQVKLKELSEKLQEKLNNAVKKFKEQLEKMVLRLVPVPPGTDMQNEKAVIQARKDKLKEWKNQIKITTKIVNVAASKIMPGIQVLLTNFPRKMLSYKSNGRAINDVLDGVYEIKLIKLEQSGLNPDQFNNKKTRLLEDRDSKKRLIEDYLGGLDLFYDLYKTLERELMNPDFVKEFGEKIKQITLESTQSDRQAYIDLYMKIRQFAFIDDKIEEQRQSVEDIFNNLTFDKIVFEATTPSGYAKYNPIGEMIKFVNDKHAFRALDDSFMRNLLLNLEKRYLRETQAYIDKIVTNPIVVRTGLIREAKKHQQLLQQIKFTPPSVIKDPSDDLTQEEVELLNSGYYSGDYDQASTSTRADNKVEQVPKKEYNVIVLLFEGIRWLINKIADFLKKLYTTFIKPITSRIDEEIQKQKDNYLEWVKKHQVERVVNKDARLFTAALNLATKVFWTGYQWIAPDGTTYRVVTPPPPMPILKTKIDQGAYVAIREIATNFNKQLTLLTGIVTPPPVTGIPPIPFTGYR